MAKTKYVYSFGDMKADGNASMKDLLGGKGANMAEMNLFWNSGISRIYNHYRSLYSLQPKGSDFVIQLIKKRLKMQ